MATKIEWAATSMALGLIMATWALGAGAATAASLPADSTAVLSGAPSLLAALPAPAGDAATTRWGISRNGRYVAFDSDSDGLVNGDDDYVNNVYVKDRATGAVTLVSRRTGAAGEPSHGFCADPAISDDGSRVAFSCNDPLDPADTNDHTDVYVRDLASATTILASRAGNLGTVGNDPSALPVLSATGEYVAFESEATNLDPDATTPSTRVYRRRLGGTNPTIAVSRRPPLLGGAPVPGDYPSISDDGNVVAFATGEPLDGDDTNGADDVYVRDVAAATTVLASRASGAGAVGNRESVAPAIAGDGSAVAFESEATQLDGTKDGDPEPDVYLRSLTSQTTTLVSVNGAGKKGTTSTEPSIDSSGLVVGFLSRATALDPADTDPSEDAYVKNVATGGLYVVSRADGATGEVANADAFAVAVSGDGTKIAAGLEDGHITPDVDPRTASVIVRDLSATAPRTFSVARPAGAAPFVNQGGFADTAVLSADGRFAAFHSEAAGLGLPDGVTEGIFVRDRVTGTVTLASRDPEDAAFPGYVNNPAISADGRRVAFVADSATPGQRNIWVRDLVAGRTRLASRASGPSGAPANGISSHPALDADGSRVAFESNAANLGDGDTDTTEDVHVRDLETNRTILVSRGDGPSAPKGNNDSFGPDLNADGTRVSFLSSATNLGDGDTDGTSDVHLRNLAAQSTRLLSATPGGVKSNGNAYRASIDAAGTAVAFEAVATNLLGATLPTNKVFVRDLAAGTLVLASRADGANGAPAGRDAQNSAISPDGGYVTFDSTAGNLAPAAPTDVREVYRRSLAAGRTDLVSRRTGPAGIASTRDAYNPDISEGGACVTFTTEGLPFGPPSDYEQTYIRAFRANCGDAVPVASRGGGTPDRPAGPAGVTEQSNSIGQTGPTEQAGPTGADRDTVAPTLSGVRLDRRRFRVARAATALAAVRRGTVLRFRSSEAGTLSIAIERVRRHRGRTTYGRATMLTRRIAAGSGRVALSGRLGRRRLASGRYRLTLTARDAADNLSRPVRLTFTIV